MMKWDMRVFHVGGCLLMIQIRGSKPMKLPGGEWANDQPSTSYISGYRNSAGFWPFFLLRTRSPSPSICRMLRDSRWPNPSQIWAAPGRKTWEIQTQWLAVAAKPLLGDELVWGLCYPSYIGEYFIIQYIGIPINQPGLNGMREGFWTLLNYCFFFISFFIPLHAMFYFLFHSVFFLFLSCSFLFHASSLSVLFCLSLLFLSFAFPFPLLILYFSFFLAFSFPFPFLSVRLPFLYCHRRKRGPKKNSGSSTKTTSLDNRSYTVDAYKSMSLYIHVYIYTHIYVHLYSYIVYTIYTYIH